MWAELITLIFISILLVIFDSIERIHERYYSQLRVAEWIITFIFTIEYILRIYAVGKPRKYVLRFYGIIDLLAILPGYIVFIFSAGQNLIVLRAVRFIRLFRILKLSTVNLENSSSTFFESSLIILNQS